MGGDAVKRGLPGMGDSLVLLTGGASLDVVRHPLLHSRPLNMFTRLSKGLIPSRVASRGMVIVNGHQRTFLGSGEVSLDPVDCKPVFGNQCDVLIIPVAMVYPWGARQSVGGYIGLPGDISDFIVIFLEVGMPPGSSSV